MTAARQYWTTLDAGGDMRAHVSLAATETASKAGVVIIHGGLGIEPGLLVVPKRFAFTSYSAIVPDMFHRDPDAEGRSPRERIARLTWEGAQRDVEAAIAHLRAEAGIERICVLGFCMGGALAWMCAATLDVKACIAFYPHEMFAPFGGDGVVPFDLTPRVRVPVLGHFGTEDKNPSLDDMRRLDEALTAQGTTHQFHTYEGAGHGFAIKRDDASSFAPIRANTALDRSIGWVEYYVRHAPAAERSPA